MLFDPNLPIELNFYILNFVSVSDLYTLFQVNQLFLEVCSDNVLWKSITRKHYPDVILPKDCSNWKNIYKYIIRKCSIFTITYQDWSNQVINQEDPTFLTYQQEKEMNKVIAKILVPRSESMISVFRRSIYLWYPKTTLDRDIAVHLTCRDNNENYTKRSIFHLLPSENTAESEDGSTKESTSEAKSFPTDRISDNKKTRPILKWSNITINIIDHPPILRLMYPNYYS